MVSVGQKRFGAEGIEEHSHMGWSAETELPLSYAQPQCELCLDP